MRFTKNFMTYRQAKAYTNKAGIKTQIEYKMWKKGLFKKAKLKFPKDKIPANPHETYKKQWISWGNFLGTGNPAPKTRVYISLKEAFKISKELSRKYKLHSQVKWYNFFKDKKNKKILEKYKIPVSPYMVYGKEFSQKGGFYEWVGKGA